MSTLTIIFYAEEPTKEWQSSLREWTRKCSREVDFYCLVPTRMRPAFSKVKRAIPKLSIQTADFEQLGGSFSQIVTQSKSDWLLFLDARLPLRVNGLQQLLIDIKNQKGDASFLVVQRSNRKVKRWNQLQHVDPTEDCTTVFSREALLALGGFNKDCRFRPLYDLVLRGIRAGHAWKQLNIELVGSVAPLNRSYESLEEGLRISQAHYGRVSQRWALRIGRAAADLAGLKRSSSVAYDRHVLNTAAACHDGSEKWSLARLRVLHTFTESKAILKSPRNALRLCPRPKFTVLNRCIVKTKEVTKLPQTALYRVVSEIPNNRYIVKTKEIARLPQKALNHVRSNISRCQDCYKSRIFQLGYHEAIPCLLPVNKVSIKRPSAVPTISITTPNLNQGKTIERTILSVLSQDYPHLEYTVQDGVSKDESVSVIRRYEGQLARWSSKADRGQSEAIVRGFEGTTGEIMGYLNSDDVLLPGALAFVGQYFARHPKVDVLYGDRILIDDYDREINRWYLPAHDDEVIKWADYIPQETMFWRRRAWDAVGGIDDSFQFAMDWDLILRFRRAGMRFVHVPRLFGAFRISDNQKSSAQIATTGLREMSRLRERELGYVPTQEEVTARVRGYVRKHQMVSGWRLLKQHWTATEDWTASVAETATLEFRIPVSTPELLMQPSLLKKAG